MKLALVGAAIITTAVAVDRAWKARKKEKQKKAIENLLEKNQQALDLLKDLRAKAYL